MDLLRLLTSVLIVLQFLLCPLPTSASNASRVIENLNQTLLAVMKEADQLGYPGRYERLAPVIEISFDLPFIAKVAVGRSWRKFDDEQKSQFVETFSKLSIATYAGRFNSYSGERFKVVSEEKLNSGRILIRSLLIKSDGEKIHLDYLLHQRDNHWRIINVIADGVSDLSLKRADYSSFLKKGGFHALLSKLNDKILRYAD